MMENRYGGILRDNNQQLMALMPAHLTLRVITALELGKHLSGWDDTLRGLNDRILEIGVGEGDGTAYLLEYNPGIKIDALDVSPEMIEIARKNLPNDRVNFIVQDGLDFLRANNTSYDLIISEWTIHNFPWDDKRNLFREIYRNLRKGGKMILMDKVYPDDENLGKYYFDLQNRRYAYLPLKLSKPMIEHETKDASPSYKMNESQLTQELNQIGFSDVRIVDRLEREVVLVAEKPR